MSWCFPAEASKEAEDTTSARDREGGERRGEKEKKAGSVRTRGAVLLFYTANSCDIRRNKHG